MAILAARRSEDAVDLQECNTRSSGVGLGRALRLDGGSGGHARRAKREQSRSNAERERGGMPIRARPFGQNAISLEAFHSSHEFAPVAYAKSAALYRQPANALPRRRKNSVRQGRRDRGHAGLADPGWAISLLGTMYTSISGDSKIRSIG